MEESGTVARGATKAVRDVAAAGPFLLSAVWVAVRPAPDLDLLEIYKELNAAWFNGKLPEDHLRISWDSITERNGDNTPFYWVNRLTD